MIRISKFQLFSLMLIFEIGSTPLFALGIEAKQDAWIAILAALLVGIVFAWIYTELQKAFPDKNYVEIVTCILGNKLGIPLVLLSAADWFYGASRNIREFGEMIIIQSLPETPLEVIIIIFVSISLYALLKGVEVIARISELIMPLIIFFIISIYVLIYLSGRVDFSNITPVLGEGIKPVLKSAFPSIAVFPFGEMLVFSMYWCYAEDKNSVRKLVMLVTLISGILLSISLIVDISVLGVGYTSIASIPFIEVIKLINIMKILSNIESIGIMILFFGGFFKMSIFLNGVILTLTTVFKIKKNKAVTIACGVLIIWFSIIFEPNYVFHMWMFPFDTYFRVVVSHVFPLSLLIIYWIKKKRARL